MLQVIIVIHVEIIVADVFVVYVYVFIYVNLSGFFLLLRGYVTLFAVF